MIVVRLGYKDLELENEYKYSGTVIVSTYLRYCFSCSTPGGSYNIHVGSKNTSIVRNCSMFTIVDTSTKDPLTRMAHFYMWHVYFTCKDYPQENILKVVFFDRQIWINVYKSRKLKSAAVYWFGLWRKANIVLLHIVIMVISDKQAPKHPLVDNTEYFHLHLRNVF